MALDEWNEALNFYRERELHLCVASLAEDFGLTQCWCEKRHEPEECDFCVIPGSDDDLAIEALFGPLREMPRHDLN